MNIPKFFLRGTQVLLAYSDKRAGIWCFKTVYSELCDLTLIDQTETPDKIQGFFDFTFLVAEVEL